MKQLFSVLSLVVILASCKKSDIALPERIEETKSELIQHGELSYRVVSTAPFRISSDRLKEVKVILNGVESYGYIDIYAAPVKPSDNPLIYDAPVSLPVDFSIVRGYFLYGPCMVYGTLITGNDGNQIFIPCSANGCIGSMFEPICPENGAYTRQQKSD